MSAILSALLVPIDADAPCGIDLALSGEVDQIREMRRADDPSVEQGEWKTELKSADWRGVLAACDALLRSRTKDIRIAGWWLEASAKLQAYEGLAAGIALVDGLVQVFWTLGLHPLSHGTDMEMRVGSLNWTVRAIELAALNSTLFLTGPHGVTLALLEGQLFGGGGAKAEGKGPAWQEVESTAKGLGVAYFKRQLDFLQACASNLQALAHAVDERLGADGPNFTKAVDRVDRAEQVLRRFMSETGLGLVPVHADRSMAESVESDGPADALQLLLASSDPGVIRTRAQALLQLREIAAFFRRTEPHSPVAYLADRAIEWAEMPLHTWLKEVIREEPAIARLNEMLGIKNPSGRSA